MKKWAFLHTSQFKNTNRTYSKESSSILKTANLSTYVHQQTVLTSRPCDEIEFTGYSYPHFSHVRHQLDRKLCHYPSLPPRRASYADFATVHSPDYIRALRDLAEGKQLNDPPKLSVDCRGLEYCLPGYLFGLGGMLEAIDWMKTGALLNAYCFSLPGHHAHRDWGHGYCLLNPSAAAARYAQRCGFEKILIVDWDLHHGDGTQSIFARDPTIHCISIHSAVDFYMMQMSDFKQGTTIAEESTGHQNIPIMHHDIDDKTAADIGFEGEYFRADQSLAGFRQALEKIPWQPDLIFIFSGYDSHREDHGQDIADWSNEDFIALTKQVQFIASRNHCPILSVHGGGYDLPVTISAALAHIKTLA